MSDLLKPGQLFAERYRIQRFLAEGGMGAVFVAGHVTTEQRVAVKVLWPNVLQSDGARRQFELEAKLAARIGSEHVVSVIDAGIDPETHMPFLAMELLEGATLQDLAERRGPIPPREVCAWLIQAARGLDKAHQHVATDGRPSPIVHRDLKPENLFLTRRETGEPLVKILDFGIAKVLSQTAVASAEIKGTPLFMAPEQAMGLKPCPQTDVWSLGLIVFYLVSGRHYWKAAASEEATVSALLLEITHLDLVEASARAGELGCGQHWPTALDPWLERCLQREPGARFASAGEAVQALQASLAGTSVAFAATRASDPPRSPPPAELDAGQSLRFPPAGHLAETAAASRAASRAGRARRIAALIALLIAGVAALAWLRSAPAGPAAGAPPTALDDDAPPRHGSQDGRRVVPGPAVEPADEGAVATGHGLAAPPQAQPEVRKSEQTGPASSAGGAKKLRKAAPRKPVAGPGNSGPTQTAGRPARRAPEEPKRNEVAGPDSFSPSVQEAAPEPATPSPPRDPYEGR